ncbi:Predicted membrane protein [Reichenbachiella faecimaris]|uniref:Predicted membrane protein n=1 Tax=Reichenbachiella faecimaris TaxID=692418 RepID=A0A1W2G7G1_REIFA|nr:LiaF domain-containing protein [Reichenbachiella faecimaris]SMD32607.1 Predicted membrane protein [Reichenbachiella faecimaris]
MRHYKLEDRSNLIGLALVIIGGIFLLVNFDILPVVVENLAFNWKGIVLVVGIVLYATKSNKLPGLFMIIGAMYFIIATYVWQEYHINIGLSRIFWPGLMIAAGILLLNKRKIEFKRKVSGQSFDYLNDSNIMGGGEVKVRSEQFKGGQTSAVFGGASYDMTGSKLAEGNHTLEVLAVFGGFTFIVPSDWEIQLDVTAIFGALADKRKFVKPPESGTNKRLRIKGFVLFGGGEIKNY